MCVCIYIYTHVHIYDCIYTAIRVYLAAFVASVPAIFFSVCRGGLQEVVKLTLLAQAW